MRRDYNWNLLPQNLQFKPITEYNENDTFYGSKPDNGYERNFYCQFIDYKRGCVKGKIIFIYDANYINDMDNIYRKGDIIVFKLNKVYLVGEQFGDSRKHWRFNGFGKIEE